MVDRGVPAVHTACRHMTSHIHHTHSHKTASHTFPYFASYVKNSFTFSFRLVTLGTLNGSLAVSFAITDILHTQTFTV